MMRMSKKDGKGQEHRSHSRAGGGSFEDTRTDSDVIMTSELNLRVLFTNKCFQPLLYFMAGDGFLRMQGGRA